MDTVIEDGGPFSHGLRRLRWCGGSDELLRVHARREEVALRVAARITLRAQPMALGALPEVAQRADLARNALDVRHDAGAAPVRPRALDESRSAIGLVTLQAPRILAV